MLNIEQAVTQRQSLENFQRRRPYGTALSRVQFIKQVGASLQVALQNAIAACPFEELPSPEEQDLALGSCQDIVENLFYRVSGADRETVEEAEDEEARAQREHEAAERDFVRRF